MNIEDESLKPWYRQFWCWFVFSPLIIIVIACSFFVTTAVRNSDDVIIDNYYKEGRTINQTFDQDRRARELGLSAETDFDVDTGEVVLTFSAANRDLNLPQDIVLVLSHPAKQNLDQFIALKQSAEKGVYRGELSQAPHNSWYVLVYAVESFEQRNEAEWIIGGQINFEERQKLTLQPRN